MKTLLATILLLFAATAALADTTKDQEAYCAYVTQTAEAQKIFLRSPSLSAGLSQEPISTGVPQLYSGVTNSLSSDRKASLVMKAAGKDCELYRVSIELMQRVQFALPLLERGTLQARIKADDEALAQLDALLDVTQKQVEVQNSTSIEIASLRSAKARIEIDRSSTSLMLASQYVPEAANTPLRDLLAQKAALEIEKQKADNKVAKQDNWDVALTAGIHHDVATTFARKPEGYGGFHITYNFGAHKRDLALDSAAEKYGEYKEQQQSDSAFLSSILRQRITESITVQEKAQAELQDNLSRLDALFQSVSAPETHVQLAFNHDLVAQRLVLVVELATTQARLQGLKQYLVDNF